MSGAVVAIAVVGEVWRELWALSVPIGGRCVLCALLRLDVAMAASFVGV